MAALHERTRDIMDKLRETLRDEHSFSFQARYREPPARICSPDICGKAADRTCLLEGTAQTGERELPHSSMSDGIYSV